MAALRQAARMLLERALQRSHRVSPGRLPMSTSSSIKGKREVTCEEAEKGIERSKQELEDAMRRLVKGKNDRTTATNSRKSQSRGYGTTAKIALPLFLGSVYYTQEW